MLSSDAEGVSQTWNLPSENSLSELNFGHNSVKALFEVFCRNKTNSIIKGWKRKKKKMLEKVITCISFIILGKATSLDEMAALKWVSPYNCSQPISTVCICSKLIHYEKWAGGRTDLFICLFYVSSLLEYKLLKMGLTVVFPVPGKGLDT